MSDLKPIDTSHLDTSTKYGIVLKKLNDAEDALAASQRRERDTEAKLSETYRRADGYVIELAQLQSRLAAAEALVPLFRERGRDMNQHSATRATFHVCADKLKAALTPPPAPVSGESNG